MKKYQLLFISLMILLSMVAFASCSPNQNEADAQTLISESVDTPITITGYTDFGKGDPYFLKKGDKIAVITPSAIPDEKKIEDTMNGLVPLASVGKALGVKTPIMDAFITLASIICGRDFASEGRTAEKLGFAGKTAAEIREMVK